MEKGAYTQRLDYRPGSQPGKGRLYEDLGSSFNVPGVKRPEMVDLDSDSEDELDSLPPSSQPTHQRVRPETDEVIKTLKFKKKKPPGADAEVEKPTFKENTRRVASDSRAHDNRKNAIPSSSTRPLREKGPNRSQTPPDARAKRTAATLTSQRTAHNAQCEKPERPTARRVMPPTQSSSSTPKPKPHTNSTVISSRSTGKVGGAKGKSQETGRQPKSSTFPEMSPLSDAKGKGKQRERTAVGFPSLSPLGDSRGTANGMRKETDRSLKANFLPSPLSSQSQDFLPSPLGTPLSNRALATSFPAPSPLRLEGHPKPKHKEAHPFPMNSQTLQGTSGKRRSVGSDSDDEPDRKRSKKKSVVSVESYEYEEDSELFFISPGTDPKTLCPYCDTPLPAQPTPMLTRLLDQTFNKSYRDPRPSNPLGRKAPMGVFAAVCQRHRYESETLPEAEARGWPKSIDWSGLKGRVLAMKRDLAQILADPGDPIVYGNEANQKDRPEPQRPKGPRMRCLFWKDLVKDLKSSGTKGVKGVQGQFANFDKTQPGYYGELGSVIIHQTLYDMFPLATVDSDLVDPLTPNEFIQRILVPEVGMRLVIEDMSLDVNDRSDKKRAVAVLRESASYGVAMFPEDGGEGAGVSGKRQNGAEDAMGVADLMVMERARRRRKELEIEEREEDEMLRVQHEEEEAEKKRRTAETAKEKRKARKGKEKEEAPVEKTIPRPRPRPVPKNKGKPMCTAASTSGMDTGSSSDPRRSRNDSDAEMLSRQTSVEPVLTPKPRRPRPERPETSSDSEEFTEVLAVFPVQRARSKSRPRAVAASSDLKRLESGSDLGVKTSSSQRSPSVSVTGSKLATRGSSVVNLCSSSDDGGLASDGPRKPRNPRRKPRKPLPPQSSEEDEEEATPRAKGSQTPTVASSPDFFPLEAARRRAKSVKGKQPTGNKESSSWLHSMAIDISDDDEESDVVTSWRPSEKSKEERLQEKLLLCTSATVRRINAEERSVCGGQAAGKSEPEGKEHRARPYAKATEERDPQQPERKRENQEGRYKKKRIDVRRRA
ncbi:RTC4-like domain-containing protein [Mycena galericulata]|nr:RTC4-like domain-containing protein [Mycena galericulata]